MALEGGTYRTTRSTRLGIVSLRADSIPVLDKISVKWVFRLNGLYSISCR